MKYSTILNFHIYFTFFLKFKKQGKFQNPHDEHILKLYLSFIFGKKLTEIFKFKDKNQNSKWHSYFFVWL